MSDKPIFCMLSNESTPPKEAKKAWGGGDGICMKPSFMYKGVMMNVFFPNIPALKKDNGGYKVTWPMLRTDIKWEEVRSGLINGFYAVD